MQDVLLMDVILTRVNIYSFLFYQMMVRTFCILHLLRKDWTEPRGPRLNYRKKNPWSGGAHKFDFE